MRYRLSSALACRCRLRWIMGVSMFARRTEGARGSLSSPIIFGYCGGMGWKLLARVIPLQEMGIALILGKDAEYGLRRRALDVIIVEDEEGRKTAEGLLLL